MRPELRSARARLAAGTRYRPNDPALDDTRRELRAGMLEDHVRRVVDEAPPLTQEQRDRIAAVLSGPDTRAEPA